VQYELRPKLRYGNHSNSRIISHFERWNVRMWNRTQTELKLINLYKKLFLVGIYCESKLAHAHHQLISFEYNPTQEVWQLQEM